MSISADRRHVHHLPAPGSGYAQKSARDSGELAVAHRHRLLGLSGGDAMDSRRPPGVGRV